MSVKLAPQSPEISPWARGAAANPKMWFQKGYDPRRKPRGPNKISEQFFKDLLTVWEQHGEECLRRAFVIDPVSVMRIVAKLMLREIDWKALESEGHRDSDDALLALFVDAVSPSDCTSNRSNGATR